MGYVITEELPLAGARNRFQILIDGGAETLPEIKDKVSIARTSEAISVATGEKWILNSNWEWVKSTSTSSDSGSTGGSSSGDGTFTLSPATLSTLGGIIVGDYLSITSAGKLSVNVDTAVSNNSSNLVTSQAVYQEIGDISTILKSI